MLCLYDNNNNNNNVSLLQCYLLPAAVAVLFCSHVGLGDSHNLAILKIIIPVAAEGPAGCGHSNIARVCVLNWLLPLLTSVYFLTVTDVVSQRDGSTHEKYGKA